ncbi:MAG: ABC transporter permease [Candidatus Thorarchaeota archaeon]|nr:ABC transporter permease [Candidatus Thorarchaeota archaeon]
MSDKKGTWKDSNWYVSITGFWREFKRHKIGILGVFIIFLFFGMAVTAPILATHDPSPSAKIAPPFLAPGWTSVFDPGYVHNAQYLPDPYLNTMYSPSDDLHTNQITTYGPATYGNASSFSGTHHIATGANDKNYIELTWDHHAGDRPDFHLPWPGQSEMPDCDQFIYYTQTFKWSYDRIPNDVIVTFNFSATLTGDFASHDEGGLMFKVYAWLIDSSGNWRNIYKSSPPYTEVIQSRNIDLNFFDILDGWGGMVKNATGQEDPKDQLTLAIGLAPTRNFYFAYDSYNGSVSTRFYWEQLYAYGDYFGVLGTTDKGGDAWSQLVYGSRISLIIGLVATALSTAVGVIVGMVAGYFGGKTDEILMRVVDFLLVIPGLPLMMVLAAFLGPTIQNIIVVIAILGWTGTARLIRSQVLAEKNKAYVESARAIGASDTYIIFRHILPNVTPILFANITLGVVGAILSEAGLSFLGLTDPSQPSWGRMLADARSSGGFSNGAWWVVVFPGMMITALSLAFTFVGHTLDQVLNPRLRER